MKVFVSTIAFSAERNFQCVAYVRGAHGEHSYLIWLIFVLSDIIQDLHSSLWFMLSISVFFDVSFRQVTIVSYFLNHAGRFVITSDLFLVDVVFITSNMHLLPLCTPSSFNQV